MVRPYSVRAKECKYLFTPNRASHTHTLPLCKSNRTKNISCVCVLHDPHTQHPFGSSCGFQLQVKCARREHTRFCACCGMH